MASKPNWAATPEEVANLPRNAVHAMIDRLIGWLDEQDGDPDIEPNGDEMDVGVVAWGRPDPLYRLPEHRDAAIALAGLEDDEGNGDEMDNNGSEEDFISHRANGPGCPIADAGEDSDEDRCLAGDDGVFSGNVISGGAYNDAWDRKLIGSEDDAEPEESL